MGGIAAGQLSRSLQQTSVFLNWPKSSRPVEVLLHAQYFVPGNFTCWNVISVTISAIWMIKHVNWTSYTGDERSILQENMPRSFQWRKLATTNFVLSEVGYSTYSTPADILASWRFRHSFNFETTRCHKQKNADKCTNHPTKQKERNWRAHKPSYWPCGLTENMQLHLMTT